MSVVEDLGGSAREAVLRKLRIDIGKLSADSPTDPISEIINRIASCNLDEISRDRLLQTIKGQTRTPIGVLRKQLAEAVRARRTTGRDAGQIEGMILDAFGEPMALEANAVALIRDRLLGLFALNEFRQVPMILTAPPWARSGEVYPRPITDADDAALLTFVQRNGVHLRGRPAIRTVRAELIHDHVFHPVRDYLDGLQWDGTPRLDKWVETYLCVAHVPNYSEIVGPKWMISAVARIYRPGCIAKYCLLLLGPQDLGKSTALAILGGEFYTDDIAELGTKDSALQNAGVWIVELAELASTRKAHLDSVKSFISRAVDRFRPPYGTHPVARPRQSVLAGTVNPSDAFLKDDTGNVRFWPVTCTKIDLDALRRDRDQLWAEAMHRYRAGESWWLEDKSSTEAAREEQAAHAETVEDHPWFTVIENWIAAEEKYAYELGTQARLRTTDNSFVFTMEEVLERLDIPKERWADQRTVALIGKILRRMGWKSGSARLIVNKERAVRRWQKEILTCNKRGNRRRCSEPLDAAGTCPTHGQDIGL